MGHFVTRCGFSPPEESYTLPYFVYVRLSCLIVFVSFGELVLSLTPTIARRRENQKPCLLATTTHFLLCYMPFSSSCSSVSRRSSSSRISSAIPASYESSQLLLQLLLVFIMTLLLLAVVLQLLEAPAAASGDRSSKLFHPIEVPVTGDDLLLFVLPSVGPAPVDDEEEVEVSIEDVGVWMEEAC